MEIDGALSLIRVIPNYPNPGIQFQDITPLLANAQAFSCVIQSLASYSVESNVIAGIEARGFILASSVATMCQKGFIPIRKSGKLPFQTISQTYGLEYGNDTLELHVDAISPSSKVLLIDDVLATGGTLAAAIELIQRLNGQVVQILALLEIESLAGRSFLNNRFPNIPITSLMVS